MNLIILHPNEVDSEGRAELSDDRARHIQTVLKAGLGQCLRVGLLNGPLGEGRVEAMSDDGVRLLCSFENLVLPRPAVDLILAMPRPKVMKRLWAQLAALGVGRIFLIRAAKVERYYFDSHVVDPAFYTPLLIEGLQQARCTHVPEVFICPRFRPFVEDQLEAHAEGCTRLIADPAANQSVAEVMGGLNSEKRILLAIGPEGGWDSFELNLFNALGFMPFHLGPRILRTDTACVSLLSSIHHLCFLP